VRVDLKEKILIHWALVADNSILLVRQKF